MWLRSSSDAVRWLVLAGALALCPPSAQAVTAPPLLSWACSDRAPPYCYADAQGRPAGVLVDLMREIGRDLGIDVQAQLLPWARAQARVRDGDIDMLVTLPTSERFAYAYFGREPMMVEPLRLFLRRGQPGLAARLRAMPGLEALREIKLVTYIGDGFAAEYLGRGYQVQHMAKAENIPLMLLNGRAQASLINPTLFRRWVQEQRLAAADFEQIELDWPTTQLPRLMMLSRRSAWHQRGLLKAMDKSLAAMKRDGRWQAITGAALAAVADKGLGPSAQPLGGAPTPLSFLRDYDGYPEWQADRRPGHGIRP